MFSKFVGGKNERVIIGDYLTNLELHILLVKTNWTKGFFKIACRRKGNKRDVLSSWGFVLWRGLL